MMVFYLLEQKNLLTWRNIPNCNNEFLPSPRDGRYCEKGAKICHMTLNFEKNQQKKQACMLVSVVK